MQINPSAHTGFAPDRRPRVAEKTPATGRALVVVENSGKKARRGYSSGRAMQRSTAFLAHLSLQYDTITARRRERAERLSQALASYAVKPPQIRNPSLNVEV